VDAAAEPDAVEAVPVSAGTRAWTAALGDAPSGWLTIG
jgi:hypothetical protein